MIELYSLNVYSVQGEAIFGFGFASSREINFILRSNATVPVFQS